MPATQPGRIGVLRQRARTFAMAHGRRAAMLRRRGARTGEQRCCLEQAIVGAPWLQAQGSGAVRG